MCMDIMGPYEEGRRPDDLGGARNVKYCLVAVYQLLSQPEKDEARRRVEEAKKFRRGV